MVNFNFRIIIALIILTQTLFCGGKTGFNFLTIGVDAKNIALSDAGISNPMGVGMVYYNPANLAKLDLNTSVLFTYRNWMVDGKFLYASVGIPSKFLNFALSLTSFTISDIEIRNRPGKPEGTFSMRDFSFALSIAPNTNSNTKVGVTAKYVFEKIFVDETQTVAFDIGFAHGFDFSRFNLNIGASLKDFGFKGRYRNEGVNLPTTLAFGASAFYAPLEDFKISLHTKTKFRFYENLNLASFGIGMDFLSIISLSSGYEFGTQTKSLGFGFGINLKNFSINYAFSSFEFNFPNSHSLTLEIKI
jgi:hypothetical protein